MSDEQATLFDFGEPPRTRFGSTNEELTKALLWHAQITTELQRRVLEASTYVRSRVGDRELLRILEGKTPRNETPHRPDQVDTIANERL